MKWLVVGAIGLVGVAALVVASSRRASSQQAATRPRSPRGNPLYDDVCKTSFHGTVGKQQ